MWIDPRRVWPVYVLLAIGSLVMFLVVGPAEGWPTLMPLTICVGVAVATWLQKRGRS